MEHRVLGSTGTVVSRVALGTMYFGDETDEAEAFRIIDAFLDGGGTLIDTSNVYVGGVSQQIVGRWFASRPSSVTDHVVMASKGRFATEQEPNGPGLSRRTLRRSLDSSLRALGRETIDLYQMHAWDPITPVEETLSFLDDVVHEGKIEYVGLSNFTGWQTQLFVSTAAAMGIQAPASLQIQYNLMSRESEWEMIPAAVHNGLSVLAWSPMAGGLLSGKYRRGQRPAEDTRAGGSNPLYRWASNRYMIAPRAWPTVDAVVRIAGELGVTPAQVALAWVADRPGVVAPIAGARTVQQIQEDLGAAGLHLPPHATAELDEVSAPRPETYPYGAFGVDQRARDVDGGDRLADLVSAGSDDPLAD